MNQNSKFIFTLVRENDYRLINSIPIKNSPGLKVIKIKERKECLLYQESMEEYELLIKEIGLNIKYLGWYSYGRCLIDNKEYIEEEMSTLNPDMSMSFYVYWCGKD